MCNSLIRKSYIVYADINITSFIHARERQTHFACTGPNFSISPAPAQISVSRLLRPKFQYISCTGQKYLMIDDHRKFREAEVKLIKQCHPYMIVCHSYHDIYINIIYKCRDIPHMIESWHLLLKNENKFCGELCELVKIYLDPLKLTPD